MKAALVVVSLIAFLNPSLGLTKDVTDSDKEFIFDILAKVQQVAEGKGPTECPVFDQSIKVPPISRGSGKMPTKRSLVFRGLKFYAPEPKFSQFKRLPGSDPSDENCECQDQWEENRSWNLWLGFKAAFDNMIEARRKEGEFVESLKLPIKVRIPLMHVQSLPSKRYSPFISRPRIDTSALMMFPGSFPIRENNGCQCLNQARGKRMNVKKMSNKIGENKEAELPQEIRKQSELVTILQDYSICIGEHETNLKVPRNFHSMFTTLMKVKEIIDLSCRLGASCVWKA